MNCFNGYVVNHLLQPQHQLERPQATIFGQLFGPMRAVKSIGDRDTAALDLASLGNSDYSVLCRRPPDSLELDI